jgi:transglutaminase-like putative cysteine protease
MLLHIQHETKLSYSALVSETVFEVRMAPPTDEDQTNLGYRLETTPAAPVTSYRDSFGNRVDLFNILSPYRELVVRTTATVRTHRRPCLPRAAEVSWSDVGEVPTEALEYLQPSPLVCRGASLDAFVATLHRPSGSMAGVIQGLMDAVRGRLQYEKKVTTARTPIDEALRLGRGVCQDFAHLFLGSCRALGLPARYISGYTSAPGELATHAWCQVLAGPAGWVDVDPTYGTFVADHHIKTAVGRDYSDVPPNRGVWKGRADETISVAVKVEPIEQMPHDWGEWGEPTPYPDSSFSQFQHQGRRIRRSSYNGYHQQQTQQQQA